MGTFTKIPQNTFTALQLDAGILLKTFNPASPSAPQDSDIITATTGGIEIKCVPTYEDMGADVDNCPANLKELKKLSGWECTMSFTSLAATKDAFMLALGAADYEESSGKIKPRRNLATTDFESSIWWVGDTASGGCAAVCLKNALSTDGFSLKTEKDSKGQLSITLTGHVSINSQDTMPMEFYVVAASS